MPTAGRCQDRLSFFVPWGLSGEEARVSFEGDPVPKPCGLGDGMTLFVFLCKACGFAEKTDRPIGTRRSTTRHFAALAPCEGGKKSPSNEPTQPGNDAHSPPGEEHSLCPVELGDDPGLQLRDRGYLTGESRVLSPPI